MSPRLHRLILRAGATAGVALFLGLVARYWHPVYGFTVFLQVGAEWESREIEAFRDYPVFVHDTPGTYDGVQYAQIAYHPLLDAPELHSAVDTPAYRARRILLPATAWLLAAGRPAWIANVYAGLNVVCWLVLAWCLWRVLPVDGARGLVAWAGILFSGGALSSVRFALTDLPAAALIFAALWAAQRDRPRAAAGWLAAAALTRETALLAWPGLWRSPWNSPAAVVRNLLQGALAAIPLAAWLVYVRWQVGPGEAGFSNFSWPLAGLATGITHSFGNLGEAGDSGALWATILGVAGIVAQCGFIVLRRQPGDCWWRVGAAHVLFLPFLGPLFWTGFPFGALRVLLPLGLVCNVLIARTRASLGWLLACNLTVVAGIMAVSIVPRNASELAAARSGAAAGIVRLGPGCYGMERDAHHRWAWIQSTGRLTVVTWPRLAPVTARLSFKLRGITPRTVAIRAEGREIWRGPVGTGLTPVNLPPLPSHLGRVELEFQSDTAPVRETVGPRPRLLGFALYDPVLSVSESGAADP